jgi:hypothetical protein
MDTVKFLFEILRRLEVYCTTYSRGRGLGHYPRGHAHQSVLPYSRLLHFLILGLLVMRNSRDCNCTGLYTAVRDVIRSESASLYKRCVISVTFGIILAKKTLIGIQPRREEGRDPPLGQQPLVPVGLQAPFVSSQR